MSSAVRRPTRTAPVAFHSSRNSPAGPGGLANSPPGANHSCSRWPSSPPRKSLGSAMYPSSDIDMSRTDADTSTSLLWSRSKLVSTYCRPGMAAFLIGQPDPNFKPRHQQVRTARSPVGAQVEPTRAGRHQTGTAAQSFTGHALRACTPRGSSPVVTEDGSCSAREVTQPTQSPDAGHKVVVPATVAHEGG